MKVFRWRGIVPLLIVLALVVAAWYLFADGIVRHEVEATGAEIVGARVDLASADVRLRDGVVALRGLQVADPQRPMRNLVQADEIQVKVEIAPLLENKVVIDSVAVRGVRFGTARRTSGALAHPGPRTGEVMRRIDAWRSSIRLPSLSLAGLSQVVNVKAINADSLATLRQARSLVRLADSARTAWLDTLRALDPRPQIDSANALAQRLKGASLRTLGLAGVRNAVTSARRTITDLGRLDDRLKRLQSDVTGGVGELRTGVGRLDETRRADYAYARRLLNLPSLSAPDIGPALFGQAAMDRLAPALYWASLAQRYMPPGLQARLNPGPQRARAAGTTVTFPKTDELPTFLLRSGEASVSIAGGAAAGDYTARVSGVTSEPTVYGRPTTFSISRTSAAAGPTLLRADGELDHVRRPTRDSLSFRAEGVALPTIRVPALDATLDLGRGTTRLELARSGDSIRARWSWRAPDVSWSRVAGARPAGATGAVVAALWSTVTGVKDVQIEARMDGPLSAPRLSVSTNIAAAVATSLQRQLGQRAARAEAMVRARVDSLVRIPTALAQTATDSARTLAMQGIQQQRDRLDQARKQLEARVKQLTGLPLPGLGGGEAGAAAAPATARALPAPTSASAPRSPAPGRRAAASG